MVGAGGGGGSRLFRDVVISRLAVLHRDCTEIYDHAGQPQIPAISFRETAVLIAMHHLALMWSLSTLI